MIAATVSSLITGGALADQVVPAPGRPGPDSEPGFVMAQAARRHRTTPAAGSCSNEGMDLEEQMRFIGEAGRLKAVLRQTPLTEPARRENSAEHSWHLAVMALVLADHAPPGTDLPPGDRHAPRA